MHQRWILSSYGVSRYQNDRWNVEVKKPLVLVNNDPKRLYDWEKLAFSSILRAVGKLAQQLAHHHLHQVPVPATRPTHLETAQHTIDKTLPKPAWHNRTKGNFCKKPVTRTAQFQDSAQRQGSSPPGSDKSSPGPGSSPRGRGRSEPVDNNKTRRFKLKSFNVVIVVLVIKLDIKSKPCFLSER